MKRCRTAHLAISFLLMLATLWQPVAHASGGDGYEENAFAPEHHVPAGDLLAYASGNLGVVPNSYWRIYLFIAYRALSEHALTSAELATLNIPANGWQVGSPNQQWAYTYDNSKNGINDWLAARAAITGSSAVKPGVEKWVDYGSYINCPLNAFNTASNTLQRRLQLGGQRWAAIWLAGQDAVFANCSPSASSSATAPVTPAVLPAVLPANAPAWLVQDHAYQTAAALFYAGQFQLARARFLAIAQDPASPWQPLGGYLAARCLLREASLLPGADTPAAAADNPARTALFGQARSELLVASAQFPPARSLLGWVDAKLRPQKRLDELALLLASAPITAERVQDVADFLTLMDKSDNTALANLSAPMNRWITAMQSPLPTLDDTPDSSVYTQHLVTLQRIRSELAKTPTTLWHMALLVQAQANELNSSERRKAAAVPVSSPAFQTLQYNLARLELLDNQADAADLRINRILDTQTTNLSSASRNRWLALKMLSSKSEDGFFVAAQRRPINPDQGIPIPNETQSPASQAVYDSDFYRHLYHDFSLQQLYAAVRRSDLPPSLRTLLAEITWTRAIILGDYAIADALTNKLAQPRITTQHLYARFKTAQSKQARLQAATLILVNTPELIPRVPNKYGWTSCWGSGGDNGSYWPEQTQLDQIAPHFQSPTQRETSRREQRMLTALPKRSDYLAPSLLAYARAFPNDPEVPKALHFFVASTRLECGPDSLLQKPTQYSRTAFRLLHQRYPDNEWTLKTPYYF